MSLQIVDGNSALKHLKALGEGIDSDDPMVPIQGGYSLRELVAQRKISGHYIQDKFGYNQLVTTTSDPEDVWEFGGIYTFSETDDITNLCSDSENDDQVISILGQYTDPVSGSNTEIEQEVSLNGQGNVLLTTPLSRVYRMQNMSGTDIEGTVYCYAGSSQTNGVPDTPSEIRATIEGDNNQTQMAIYTIPRGYVGFLYEGELGIEHSSGNFSANETAVLQYRSRVPGGVFKAKKTVTLLTNGTSIYQDKRMFPDIMPSGLDLKIHIKAVTATMGAWAAFDILLVDETEFDTVLLAAIGQLGY